MDPFLRPSAILFFRFPSTEGQTMSVTMRAAVFLALTVLLTAHTGGNQISLITETTVSAELGQNVTLNCSTDQSVTVVTFSWSDGNKTLCVYKKTIENLHNGISCSYTDDQSLLLNIQQVEQRHNGTYICILMASSGHVSKTTYLNVTESKTNSAKNAPVHGSASETKWISFLVTLTTLLSIVLDSGI